MDGCDIGATQTIVNYLCERMANHTDYTVRVFHPSAHTAVDESSLSYYIDQWDMLWRSLVSFPSEVRDPSSLEARLQTTNAFCVNIVPFSPLMITLKAETSIRNADAVRALQAWPGLARGWRGTIRPDITIHVLEADSISNEAGVSWFSGQHMNTLAVSKLPWAAGAVEGMSPKQLRRIGFEVMEWLIGD